MNTENFKIQLIATQALHDKYGFCPATEQVKLLESDGEGTYILFRVGEHEYRFENGVITNLEEQKKLDEELSANVELLRMRQRDMEELREAHAKQEKQFVTKELMLTEAYNALREKMEALKDECSKLRKALDTDEESLQAMREAIRDLKEANKCLTDQAEELKSTIHYRELALDKAAAKRDRAGNEKSSAVQRSGRGTVDSQDPEGIAWKTRKDGGLRCKKLNQAISKLWSENPDGIISVKCQKRLTESRKSLTKPMPDRKALVTTPIKPTRSPVKNIAFTVTMTDTSPEGKSSKMLLRFTIRQHKPPE